jgi:shikimate kinase
MNRIFLVGFMGSGKTVVGRDLAERLGFEFVDLDEVIVDRAGKTISEIFRESGEAAFREMEREALTRVISLDRIVIALGGGAFVSEENRRLIKQAGVSVWLDCPVEVILKRLEGATDRPLFQSPEQVRELLANRLPTYQQADLRVAADQSTPEEIADEIVRHLGQRSFGVL